MMDWTEVGALFCAAVVGVAGGWLWATFADGGKADLELKLLAKEVELKEATNLSGSDRRLN